MNITIKQKEELFMILRQRFEKNMSRHEGISWSDVKAKLELNRAKLYPLFMMEISGGEPDVIDYDAKSSEYVFCDCSPESPKGRRSLCYDREALNARKENKPQNSAIDMATEMGIQILNEAQYRKLQQFGSFDTKTSSWIETPTSVRKLGGAVFADYRYGQVFVYHNGAESYYASRGFRGIILV
ncbi:MAG: DUF4256 domain-containing protein [Bacteroidota bacterium]